jgi:hypothetical protein
VSWHCCSAAPPASLLQAARTDAHSKCGRCWGGERCGGACVCVHGCRMAPTRLPGVGGPCCWEPWTRKTRARLSTSGWRLGSSCGAAALHHVCCCRLGLLRLAATGKLPSSPGLTMFDLACAPRSQGLWAPGL